MIFDAEQYLKSKYKGFYQNHFITVDNIEKREFGIGIFGKKIANRHLEFKNNYVFNDFLRREAPFYVSCSVAYYNKPSARPMQAKELMGSDFIFEFDADDLPTACKNRHDLWFCANCNCYGTGRLETCPNCKGNTKIEDYICDECLNETKKQTKNLIDILINELGFKKEEISVSFSGHKGYHVKIKSEKVSKLTQEERNELIDYITKTGLSNKRIEYKYPHFNAGGEIRKKFTEFILRQKTKDLVKVGIIPGFAQKVVKNRKDIVSTLEKRKILISILGNDDKNKELWDKIINLFLGELKFESKLGIDTSTSIDIFKIVRVPNTIHGGAALISKQIPLDQLDAFSPFVDAYPFNKNCNIKIYIGKLPQILIAGKPYGPYYKQLVELPENIALYLLAKGAADGVIL
ncbi:MAG: hypothetical protein COT55_00570 [Candidatus Diapherotrites archaeon CG09_land_8_20_14_0_10_32_12]|nr:MAG: hypothetical protein COT55_00570 [Candidatus Diapherotrites archaeon CG09_land_8_20_14_0_10_32_12]